MGLDFKDDPVLRLLPEEGMPDQFLRLRPNEQAWRGRLWLTLFGAGYEPVHAWWFALSAESDVADMKAIVDKVPDEEFPRMVQGRLTYEAGKALEQSAVSQ